ncbi:MAG: Fibronectin type 3 domain protein [Candidatus Ozemobacter sibiricus]|uniref:Fibronectin type 3 domain protein n=1 Tax=Candidatus Ozemobacter sibiricus TaxID=2268124 RepID=A0A367ZMQ5_9BACT|nr:MAG: Fibronectin type 3 domain protein [Candidatus Ozemobacter sibiricus]
MVARQGLRLFLGLLLALVGGLCGPLPAAPDQFEPNDALEKAAVVASGVPIIGTIFPVGDHDYYRIPVPGNGVPIAVEVTADEVASNINPRLVGYDAKGQTIFTHEAPPGQPFWYRAWLGDPASLTILLQDGPHGIGEAGYAYHYNNQEATAPYRLTVKVTPLPDEHEPNGSPDAASPIELNRAFTGRLVPTADEDWYRFTIPAGKRGWVTIRVDHPSEMIALHLLLRDESGRDLEAADHPRGEPGVLVAAVASGAYRLRVIDGGRGKGEQGYAYHYNNVCSPLEYRGFVRFEEVPDPGEPNDTMASATSLTLGERMMAHLFPVGDNDWFTFEVPTPGRGRLQIECDAVLGPTCPRLRLFNPQQQEIGSAMGPESNVVRLEASLKEPGRYWLEVIDGGTGTGEQNYSYHYNNRAGPYSLRVTYTPVVTPTAPHGSPDQAFLVTLGQPVADTIFPAGDIDHFRVEVPGSGPTMLEIEIPDLAGPVAPRLEVLDANGNPIETFTAPVDDPLVGRFTVQAPASFVFRVMDGGHGINENGYGYQFHNAESMTPYQAIVRTVGLWPETATVGLPSFDHAAATQARTVSLPASFAFHLYPEGDREWIDLGDIGPGLLELDLTALDGHTDPIVEIREAGTDAAAAPLKVCDQTNRSREAGRVVLPRRARYYAVVRSGGDRAARAPLQAVFRLHAWSGPGVQWSVAEAGAKPEAAGPPDWLAAAWARWQPTVATTSEPVVDVATPLSSPLVPAGAWAAYTIDVPGAGLLGLEGGTPDRLDLALTWHEQVASPSRVLCLVGGRRDYDLFAVPNEHLVSLRLQEDAPLWLQSCLHLGASPRRDFPPPVGATWSARLTVPVATREGRLIMRGLSLDERSLKVKVNGEAVTGWRLRSWEEWSDWAWPVPDLAAGAPLLVELETSWNVLLGAVDFEAWTGTQTLRLPVLTSPAVSWAASQAARFDTIIIEGITHPCQFFLDRPETHRALQALVEQGKRVVVVCPQFFTFALNAAVRGGWIASGSPAWTGLPELLDGRYEIEGSQGAYAGAPPPHAVVFGLPGSWPVVLDRIVVQTASPDPAAQVRRFRVEVTMAGPDGPFQPVGEFEARPGRRMTEARFPAVAARFVRLTVLASVGNQAVRLGDCEFYGPDAPTGWFGVFHQSQWRNDTVQAVSDSDPLVSGRARGNPNGWPVSESNGCWVGWREAGFTAAYVDAADPEQLGITVRRTLGRGTLILETQELGYRDNVRPAAWKIANLLDVPPAQLQTLRGGGWFRASAAGRYRLTVRPAAEGRWASAPFVLRPTFWAATSTAEPNQTPGAAVPLPVGDTVEGELFPAGDRDWWRVAVDRPTRLGLWLEPLTYTLDPSLSVKSQADEQALPRTFDGSRRVGFGGVEAGHSLATTTGLYWLGVADAFPPNQATVPYRLALQRVPLPVQHEPDDRPGDAVRLESGVPVTGGVFPDGDVDHFVVEMGTGTLDLTLDPVGTEDLDAQVHVIPEHPTRGGRARVLYLVGGLADFHNLHERIGLPFEVERVTWTASRAATVWDGLDDYVAVIIDGVTDPDQFDLFSNAVQAKIQKYVEGGGRVLLTAPSVSFSELRQARGGRVASFTSQYSDTWKPDRLIDGLSMAGNEHYNGARGWCCVSGGVATPQEIVLVFPDRVPGPIDRLVVHATSQTREARARDVQLYGSTVGEHGPFTLLASLTLPAADGPHVIPIMPTALRALRVVVTSNYGHGSEVQLGEIEALTADSEKRWFGLRLCQLWEANQAVPAAIAAAGMPDPTGGPLQGLPWLDASGWIEDWAAAGFAPVVLHQAATTTRALTVFRRWGQGTLAVDMQNPGGKAQDALLWKVFALLDLPRQRGIAIDSTCGGGPGFPERQRLTLPAGQYQIRVSAADGVGAVGAYSLVATFPAGADRWPLRLTGVQPWSGQMGVHPTTTIRLNFTRMIEAASYRPGGIEVRGSQSGAVPCQAAAEPDGYALVLRPERPFADGETVTVRFAPEFVQDRRGQPVAAAAETSFVIGTTRLQTARLTILLERTGALGAGRQRVLVSGPAVGPPRLTVVWADGRREEIALQAAGPQTWSGELSIAAGAPQGPARLEATGADGTAAPPVPFTVDTVPPPAPRAPPIAQARDQGRVEVGWAAPPAEAGVAGYVLGRAAPGGPASEVARLTRVDQLAHVDQPPTEGAWEYRLAFLDAAGNQGPWSPPVTVDTDRTPPAAAPGNLAATRRGGTVTLRWEPVAEADVAGYEVFRTPAGQELPVGARPLTTVSASVRRADDAPGDGVYDYRVAARDRAGNRGPLATTRIVVDTTPARAALVIADLRPEPLPPVPATAPVEGRLPPGAFTVLATLSERLAGPPSLTLVLADGSTATGAVEWASGSLFFTAAFRVPATAADGFLQFRGEAIDLEGNAGLTLHYSSYVLDTASPTWKIWRDPPHASAIGTVTVFVQADEPLPEAPRLTWTPPGGQPQVLASLTFDYRNNAWRGVLFLATDTPDGEVTFAVTGRDLFGREGTRIREGERFFKDGVPPGPPLDLVVGPGPGGGILLRWKPPLEESPAFYSVYRGASDAVPQTPAARLATEVRDVQYHDREALGSEFAYRVSATDLAGNEGVACQPRTGSSDTTPPPPPEEVKATLLPGGQVRIAWQKPRLEAVDRYRVVREARLRDGRRQLDQIYEGPLREVDDLPRLTGDLVYAVHALDAAANESPPARTATLSYDLTPPVAKIRFAPTFGRRMIPIYGLMSVTWRDLGEVVRPGRLSLTLEFDEPVRDDVGLTWRLEADEVPRPVPLTRRGPTLFEGSLDLPSHLGADLDVRFGLQAADLAGNAAGPLGAEAELLLDSTPPAPLNRLTAVPGPGGVVRVTWAPPATEPEGEPRYLVFRSERPFTASESAQLVAADLKDAAFTDRPPRDGTWYYAATARDRAGHIGSLTPAVAVVTDAVPPAAPTGVEVKVGATVELTWVPGAGTVGGGSAPAAAAVAPLAGQPAGEPVTWRVLASPEPIPAGAGSTTPGVTLIADGLTEPRCSFVPQPWPAIHLAVVAVDAAGNVSDSPAIAPLTIGAKIPAARVRVEPPGPARGACRVRVETTVPLREPPSLWFEPAGRAPLAVALTLEAGSKSRFTGALAVDEKTGDGVGRFLFRGLSEEGLPGTVITEGATLTVDTTPPWLSLAFDPPAPLRTGPVTVRVTPNELLAAPPEVLIAPQGGSPLPVALQPLAAAPPAPAGAGEGAAPLVYVGSFTLPATLPDGQAFLRVSARDLAGNVGTRADPDRVFIDNHPPRPPIDLRAVARPHGRVFLTWQPAPFQARSGPDDVRRWRIYRADRPGVATAAAVRAGEAVGPAFEDGGIPRDGTWYFAVTAVDQAGWESLPSSWVAGLADRRPPPVPAAPTAVPGDEGVTLTWHDPAPAAGTPPDRYEVWVSWHDPVTRQTVEEKVWGPATGGRALHRPLRGGDFSYRVRALDHLDHASAFSPPTLVHYERQAPAATLAFRPPPPWATGSVAVTLETTRALAATPQLTWQWFDDLGEPGASATAIVLQGSGTTWQGRFVLPEAPSLRRIDFAWRGQVTVAGKTYTGTEFLGPASFAIDRAGPEGRLLFTAPDLPRRDRQAILRAGRYPFVLELDEPPARPPTLAFESASGKRVNLPLTRQTDRRWEGVLLIDGATGDGVGQFFLQAVDAAGNQGTSLAEGGTVVVDTTPPGRVARLRAVAFPGGRVRLDWTPPLTATGRPDASANRFRLYRSSQEILDVRGLTPIQSVARTLGTFDEPKGAREVYYAVVAVDEAGNEGPVSLSVMTTIDREPPPPPRHVKAAITETGVVKVSWEPPPGPAPTFYNVYLETFPIVSTAGLTPNARGVPFTYLYGTPNDDGRYYFAVTAVDATLNESAPSESVEVDYRRTLPIASFTIHPDIWLRNGRYEVDLTTSKPLVEPPLVEVKHEKGLVFPLRFAGAGSRWRATLTIDDQLPEGTCGFLFTGKGEGNTVGREISRGPLFHIDRTAPLPPSHLKVVPDDANTPGAVRLTWNLPKLPDRPTEVPHLYRIYRSERPMASLAGQAPVQVVRVQYENMDEYIHHDVPPHDGTWYYCVTSGDLAGNESSPSAVVSVVSSTKVPRLVVRLFTEVGGPVPVDRIGGGPCRVEVRSSQPLASLTLHWYEVTRDEKLAGVVASRTAVPMTERAGGPASEAGLLWEGRLVIDQAAGREVEAAFEARAVGRDGTVGTFITAGRTFWIDTVGPEARIRIPSINTMRIDALANQVVVAPVRGGPIEVTVETLGELAQPPELAWAIDGRDDWQPITLRGFGAFWSGWMEIPHGIASASARFRYRGVDRIGNVSTAIEPRKYERKLDEEGEIARTLESYATTGGVFTIDSVPPEPPIGLQVEQKKLGIAVIKWTEGPGDPRSFNLYRSLTPITTREGLIPVKTGIYAPIIVDDPPVDGNWFYAVTQLDLAGNESEVSETKSIFIDSIKPELKITAVPSGDDFIILADEEAPPEMRIELRFPGGKTMEVDLGGSSGQLQEIQMPGGGPPRRGRVLPQILRQFDGRVEIVVHSPDPAGNEVQQLTSLEAKPVAVETGGRVESADQLVQLEIPAGLVPVVPKGPGEFQRVGGYQNLFFIRYENIPDRPRPAAATAPVDPREPDPLPPSLEVIGTPYRIELNVNTEKPLSLKAGATQADLSQLKELAPKLRLKVPELGSEAVADVDYLASRLKVVKWVPATRDEAEGRTPTGKRGRWEIVEDIEISTGTGEIIAPARDITTYVVVSERTPPTICDLSPAPDSTVKTFRPVIQARLIDKGTGIAQGAENPIALHIDGMPADRAHLKLSTEDPTEVTLTYTPPADLTPGAHIVTLRVQDVVENESVRRWRFVIDNEPPRITSVLPASGTALGVGRPVISVVAADEGGGIDPERTHLTLDGASLTVRFDPVAGRLVAHPPRRLPSGVHRVQVQLEDRGGKKVAQTWDFRTDVEPPEIRLVQPAPGRALDRIDQPLILGVQDRGTGLDPRRLLLDLDGHLLGPSRDLEVTDVFSYDPVLGQVRVQPAGGFRPGPHRVLLCAEDRFGHVQVAVATFAVDVTPPQVTWRAPGPDWQVPAGAVTLQVQEESPGLQIQTAVPYRYDPWSGMLVLLPPATAAGSLEVTLVDAAGFTAVSRIDPTSGKFSVKRGRLLAWWQALIWWSTLIGMLVAAAYCLWWRPPFPPFAARLKP